MNDQKVNQKKPRKILGTGSSIEYTSSVNNLNANFCIVPCQQTSQLDNTNYQRNTNSSILTESANSIASINSLQQHHMERLRMGNIMNQPEMHALWPYGTTTFLSPVLPAHNVPLPYALAGTLPYAAIPIYQSLPNANSQPCTVSPASSSSSGSSSGIISTSNQQHQLLRSNSIINNSCTNDLNSSRRNSPILLSSDESSAVFVNGAGGDATNSLSAGSGSGSVTLSQAKFNELTRLALRGSEIAEKLAYTHRNRPCFKKIDSLCARMKQDLIRPDGVLPNINSQGIAWAVKDFIFVFTRVINAWIIIKGYVYNTPEGLNKVKSALSPDFAASFAAWQDTTMDFIENLIKSFVNLDNLVQSQKNVYQKTDSTTANGATVNRNGNVTTTTPIKILQNGNPLLEEPFDFLCTSAEKCMQNSLDKNYIYTMVEDSEGSQRQATVNGTYFKTGTYTPIKKDALVSDENCTSSSSTQIFSPTTNNTALEQYMDERLNEFWTNHAIDIDLASAVKNVLPPVTTDLIKIKENIALNWMNYDLRVLEHQLSEFSTDYDANGPPQPLGKELIEKLNIMIERLNAMKSADFFFKMQFTENYFPDFVAKHKNDFIDVRSIIFKCQIGGYQHIYEVVSDVRKIIYAGREFLKKDGLNSSGHLVYEKMHHHHPHNNSANASGATNTTQLPTQRRRKKRPNYGTRTVEVRRGYSGFGFTISGQQPCRLSCIIPNSPADQAGLRAGDCLISVNGLNVSKLPHETVVQLIGNSFGSIRMQIAEHYYSDSTDEENAAICSPAIPSLGPYRPRYVYHKTKQQRMRNSPLKKNESFLPLPRITQPTKKCSVNTVRKVTGPQTNLKRPLSEELKCPEPLPSLATTSSSSTVANVRAMVRAPLTSAALEYRAVVGYLGTIEMPKQISHSSKLQTVRSCIRKLRQEKRTPSTVLMVILPDCLKLLSNTGNLMATYASSRLNYVSSSSECENRFFGLVTSAVYSSPPEENDDEDEAAAASHSSTTDHISISNSCHVFVVDTKLCDHSQHVAKAQEFRIECTKDPISSLCLEFPNNSEYVVNLIRSMYTMRIIPPATQRSMSDDPNLHANGRHNNTAHSPQPSNHSEISTTTSNSDSGIGYNNDCSNVTDRIVVVDFPQPSVATPRSQALANVGQRPHNICQQDMQEDIASTSLLAANKRLTVRAMPDPKIPYNLKSPVRCLITSRSCDDVLNLLEQESENYDNDQEAITSLPQQCYASMDNISLHPQLPPEEEEHEFLRPHKKSEKSIKTLSLSAEEKPTAPVVAKDVNKKSLKLQFDIWNSLQDLSCQSAEVIQSSPEKLASTPDLSKIDDKNSPFERGWIQTSLRTPRADKHTLQFSLTPETTKTRKESYEAPSVCRSGSLTNSDVDRNSLNYRTSSNDLSKPLPKGPTAWGSSIEVLLADPAGIKSFAEFLKLEYAAENIFFWTACERFRNIESSAERQAEALIIYTKHLTNGSLEPVNVDSRARSLVEQNLGKAEKHLFQPAQKQIFNLMKFDCYQRFLKSELYKQCLQAEKKGKPLPYTGENLDELLKTTNFSESASLKLKKSASNAEEGRRRRSLLPWHRKANHARSKSRDRIAIEKTNNENLTANTLIAPAKSQLTISDNIWRQSASIHGSKSSLASFDAIPVNELNSNFCRVKFPDGATTITQLKPEETVCQLVERLFERRNLKYNFYDVSIAGPPLKSVELQSPAQDLSRKEIEIEQRVAFKLDLPTPKVISVKSKPKKQLYEVVRPILQRYNINPEVVEVVMRETQEKIDLTQLVMKVDNQRLQVVLKKTYPPLPQTIQTNRKAYVQPKNSIVNGLQTAQSTLDEITNKVFSDLMDVKNYEAVSNPIKFDQCSLKSEECASESSSFLKRIRNSKKSDEVTGMSQIMSKKSISTTGTITECKLATKEKIKTGVKQQFPLKVAERQDDLLEDLKRAQLARLEDQRGTEINFELPEFLRNTENLNSSSSSSNNNNNTSTISDERPPQPAPRLSIINPSKCRLSTSPIKQEEEQNSNEDFEDMNTSLRGPPPLPPKPKVLPIKPSNWGVKLTNANVAAISSNNVIVSPSARCAYLDQPSSSFV